MRRIICEKTKFFAMLLFTSTEMHFSQWETANQIQQEGLCAVSPARVHASKWARGGETIYRSRKTVYSPSSVAMLSIASIPGRLYWELAIA